jgi:hypothetical protein
MWRAGPSAKTLLPPQRRPAEAADTSSGARTSSAGQHSGRNSSPTGRDGFSPGAWIPVVGLARQYPPAPMSCSIAWSCAARPDTQGLRYAAGPGQAARVLIAARGQFEYEFLRPAHDHGRKRGGGAAAERNRSEFTNCWRARPCQYRRELAPRGMSPGSRAAITAAPPRLGRRQQRQHQEAVPTAGKSRTCRGQDRIAEACRSILGLSASRAPFRQIDTATRW